MTAAKHVLLGSTVASRQLPGMFVGVVAVATLTLVSVQHVTAVDSQLR